MRMPDDWQAVWSALSDESLENRLRHYYWLSTAAPKIYIGRFAALVEEARRRGKPQMVDRAKEWVKSYGPSALA